jgi:hypothetical protein
VQRYDEQKSDKVRTQQATRLFKPLVRSMLSIAAGLSQSKVLGGGRVWARLKHCHMGFLFCLPAVLLWCSG